MARLLSDLNAAVSSAERIATNVIPHAVGVPAFLICEISALFVPPLKMQVFCRPAAALASLFLGTSCFETAGGFLLSHNSIEIRVVEGCSGFDFFALLYAVLCGMAIQRVTRPLIPILVLVPICYAVAIFANSLRIISAVQARVFAELLPPALSIGAAHVIVGVTVFVLFLALSCHVARSTYAKL